MAKFLGGVANHVATQYAVKTADEVVNNSDAYQNDDELVIPIDANSRWNLLLFIFYNTPAAADLRYRLTVPSGMTGTLFDGNFGLSIRGTTEITAARFPNGDGTNQVTQQWADIQAGAVGGNVTLQWAQRVATVGDTTMLAGSWILGWRFPN